MALAISEGLGILDVFLGRDPYIRGMLFDLHTVGRTVGSMSDFSTRQSKFRGTEAFLSSETLVASFSKQQNCGVARCDEKRGGGGLSMGYGMHGKGWIHSMLV